MTIYRGYPTLKDGIPPLTERQETRLNEWLTEIRDSLEIYVPGPHSLSWRVEDEHREGRGHDVQATVVDGEYVAWLSMDVYGNGSDGYGNVTITHNSALDECACEPCVTFAAEGD